MSWSKCWSWIDDSWSGCGAVNVFLLYFFVVPCRCCEIVRLWGIVHRFHMTRSEILVKWPKRSFNSVERLVVMTNSRSQLTPWSCLNRLASTINQIWKLVFLIPSCWPNFCTLKKWYLLSFNFVSVQDLEWLLFLLTTKTKMISFLYEDNISRFLYKDFSLLENSVIHLLSALLFRDWTLSQVSHLSTVRWDEVKKGLLKKHQNSHQLRKQPRKKHPTCWNQHMQML